MELRIKVSGLRSFWMTAAAMTLLISCKKERNETGIELAVNGPETYAIEVIVGKPVKEVTDINQWRPDVVFWAHTENTFIPLKVGDYTVVFQNLATSKMVSKFTTVRFEEVTKINTDL